MIKGLVEQKQRLKGSKRRPRESDMSETERMDMFEEAIKKVVEGIRAGGGYIKAVNIKVQLEETGEYGGFITKKDTGGRILEVHYCPGKG